MNYPENIMYAKSHEWIKFEDDTTAIVGLTDYAQSELGSIVFVNLPQVGDEVNAGTIFADVESIKAVSDIYCPVSGVVSEINEALLDAPESINDSPYDSWLVKIADITEKSELLDVEAYKAFIEEEEKNK
ncbi:glycine cleavage system protein GcvH [Petroclostridium sp. X23]|uniref:glycine cleavage system protein GcvH n=1 Tax=Petroclostridium sp. X23 TaxID=3045146 RepID=UPI0024ADA945|nr:glycine cleavage system protein GcvH [Petroclostridium sp. X23]WHH57163.1 glycine cleavage system protein GcvH [Petroclostridium sp. X23]